MLSIGIMQGRLSKRPYPKLQDFPFDTWEQEFRYAKDIGFDSIEWLFKEEEYTKNPIWTQEGRKKILDIIKETNVKVDSLCADYFLERPFFRREGYSLDDNIKVLKELIKNSAEIGVKVILMPVLEEAEIMCSDDKEILYQAISQCIRTLEEFDVKIGFETELVAQDYLDLVKIFDHKNIGIYYDAGNAAAKGYDMKKDMVILKDHIINIHVKDRLRRGGSVFLGMGDTNFEQGIPYLVDNNFEGSFILQAYYEDDFKGTADHNYNYIKNLIKRSY